MLKSGYETEVRNFALVGYNFNVSVIKIMFHVQDGDSSWENNLVTDILRRNNVHSKFFKR